MGAEMNFIRAVAAVATLDASVVIFEDAQLVGKVCSYTYNSLWLSYN